MRLAIGLCLFIACTGSAAAKECRTPDVPAGVKVQLPPGCDNPIRIGKGKDAERDALKSEQGFIDLGSGTKVRIGGRVRVETAVKP